MATQQHIHRQKRTGLYVNIEMMIRLERATEQHGTDAQPKQKRDQLSCSREYSGDTKTGTDRWDGVTQG